MCKSQRDLVLSLEGFGTGGDTQGAYLAWKLPIVPTLEYSAHICSCNFVSILREEPLCHIATWRSDHTPVSNQGMTNDLKASRDKN